MTTPAAFEIDPIGEVESTFSDLEQRLDYRSESRLVLRPEYQAGLAGVEYFSHLWVIYRQHRSAEWLGRNGWGESAPLVLPADDERAGQGIFATRAPCRPARLGSCIVDLLRREGNVLFVRGLDALHGTPVVDVKPYVPQFDAIPDAVVPVHWAKVMERPGDAARLSRAIHWDTSNADVALGLRAGVAALRCLGVARGAPLRAELSASAFFAHGLEMATGCSPLRGTLELSPKANVDAPWSLRLHLGNRAVAFRLNRTLWTDASTVLAVSEEEILTAVEADA